MKVTTGAGTALCVATLALLGSGAGIAMAADYPPAQPPCTGDTCQTPSPPVDGDGITDPPVRVIPGVAPDTSSDPTIVADGPWDPGDPYEVVQALLVTASKRGAGQASPNTLANPRSESPTRTGADGTGVLLALGIMAFGAGTGMVIVSARARR